MAPKRVPPPSLSSDDENEKNLANGADDSDEEEEVSSSEEEELETPKPKVNTQTNHGLQSDSEDGEEEEDTDEEDEETPVPKKPAAIKPKSAPGSDSEVESDSESGKTNSSPTASDFAVKPIVSKPMPDSIKPKKPDLKPHTLVNAKPPAKRPAEVEHNGAKDSKSKKMKASNGDVENEEKKSAVNRLWSEDDEIAILQGMVNYLSEKGVDPYSDMGAFHDSIKGDLHVDVSKNQLTDKIRRLKKKYLNNVEKSGDDAVFNKPHEYKSFELSKKIWGGSRGRKSSSVDDGAKGNNGQAKKSGNKANNSKVLTRPNDKAIVVREKEKEREEVKAIVVREKEIEKEEVKAIKGGNEIRDVNGDRDFAAMYPYLDAALEVQWGREPFMVLSKEDQRLIKAKLSESGNAKEMNDKWKMFKVEELELYAKKLVLMKDMTGMFLGALNSEE